MSLGLQVRGVGLGALGVGLGIQEVSQSWGLCPQNLAFQKRLGCNVRLAH